MSRTVLLWMGALSLAFSLGCNCGNTPDNGGSTPPDDPPKTDLPKTDPPGDTRHTVVPADHPLHGRLEGAGPDACSDDAQCFKGGCSSEVCSAEEGVITTCEVVPLPGWPADAACGCVSGSCQWWSGSESTFGEGGDDGPKEGCDPPCEAPRQCLSYYGIAGPSGPQFHSCEIPCKPGKGDCPDGMKCVTIADGPGEVCAPA